MTSEQASEKPQCIQGKQWSFPGHTIENRRDIRNDLEGKITILRIDGAQREEVAVYLRDTSFSGLSGTYFGDEPLTRDSEYLLFTPQMHQQLKLIWSQETVQGVHMLGFERIIAS